MAVYVVYFRRLVPLGIAWRRAAFRGSHDAPQRNAMRRSSLPVDEMRSWLRPHPRNAEGPSALIAWHAAAPCQRIRATSPAPPHGHPRLNQTILSPGIPKNPPCCRPRVDWAGSTAGTAWRAPNTATMLTLPQKTGADAPGLLSLRLGRAASSDVDTQNCPAEQPENRRLWLFIVVRHPENTRPPVPACRRRRFCTPAALRLNAR